MTSLFLTRREPLRGPEGFAGLSLGARGEVRRKAALVGLGLVDQAPPHAGRLALVVVIAGAAQACRPRQASGAASAVFVSFCHARPRAITVPTSRTLTRLRAL